MSKSLRILHLPVAFLPWTTGGREVYAYTLAKRLKDLGADNHIAIHQDPSGREPLGTHTIDGLPVRVLPVIPGMITNRNAKYERAFDVIPGFEDYLKEIRPDVVHFHDQNAGASHTHLEVVRRLGIKSILTYHTPGQSCTQSELRYRGAEICDGFVDVTRCTVCRLSVAGLPLPISTIVARVPVSSKAMMNRDDRISRMLSARAKSKIFYKSFHSFINDVDLLHVHCRWVQQMMKRNSIADSKMVFAGTGGTLPVVQSKPKVYKPGDTIHFAFIGRCEFIKGVHILIAAIKRLPSSLPIRIHFWGPYWDDQYGKEMQQLVGDDPRFEKPVLVPHNQLPQKLEDIDATIVPSIWLETGPLSLLDSLCCGVPAIGSDLGGIGEQVTHETNGLLVKPGDPDDLARTIERVVNDPGILNRLRMNRGNVRTMEHLAQDLLPVYERLVAKND